MTDDVELTDEEKELLASADTDTAAKKDKPAPEQPKVEQPKPEPPKPEQPKSAADESKRKSRRTNRDGDDDAPAGASAGPHAGHAFAPPAQMDYGDPWGLLPVQMRHDADGNPVV